MELNCIVDNIQLLGTAIKRINIENEIGDIDSNGKHCFGLNINEPKFETNADNALANMIIDFEIEVSCNERSCKMEMSFEGVFVSKNVKNFDSFKNTVIINGAAALIGIARGKIESISASIFNSGKITIPFVNVLDYYKNMVDE